MEYATVRPANSRETGNTNGHVMVRWPGIHGDPEMWLLMLLAGPAAERRQFGSSWEFGARDISSARELVEIDLFDIRRPCWRPSAQDIDKAMPAYESKAARLIDAHWGWVINVAKHLHLRTGLLVDEIVALRPAA